MRPTSTAKPGRRPPKARSAATPYHHGALRETLLAAAQDVLLEHGVEGFTLRECARRAGVSHGAPAHHFGDARGLLSEFAAIGFEQLEARMREYRARASPEPYAQFTATGLGYVDYALSHRARFQLMFRSDRLDFSSVRLQQAANGAYAQLETTLETVAKSAGGNASSIARRAALAWSMVHGFSSLAIDSRMFADNAGGSIPGMVESMRQLLLLTRTVFESAAEPAGKGRVRTRASGSGAKEPGSSRGRTPRSR
jgi:AcrR family transcriptional regulator